MNFEKVSNEDKEMLLEFADLLDQVQEDLDLALECWNDETLDTVDGVNDFLSACTLKLNDANRVLSKFANRLRP